jgi:hypothetical protein
VKPIVMELSDLRSNGRGEVTGFRIEYRCIKFCGELEKELQCQVVILEMLF